MRKFVSITLVLLMCTMQLIAQEKTVTGKVTDESGAPIANVSIVVKGTTVGTTSRDDGSYSLKVPATGRILVFSAVSMAPTEVSIGNRTLINQAMESLNKSLEEVIVVGYGSGKRKENVAGSLTKLSGDVVESKPTANMIDALQGRVGGLQVYNSTGEPSATPTVRLHGVGSLGASNTPLYVLDGVPVGAGSIVSLNPNDIESITVLKDPSTTAIYGSRAANGVILYTTKKGRSNAPQINVSAQYGVSNLVETTEKNFSQFMNSKQLTDFWVASGYRTRAQVDATLAAFPNDTKWYKSYYRSNLPTFQTDVNMSGGGGKTTYYISGGYFKQDGLAFRSLFERYTFRSNIQSQVTDWFKFGMNLSGGFDKRQTNPYGSNSTNRGLALLAQPFYSPNDPSGKPYPNLIPGWGRYNPEYLANNIRSDGKNGQFNPMAYAELNPIKGLILRSQAGMDAYDYTTSTVQLPSYIGSLNNGNASETFERGTLTTVTNTAEYKFSLPQEHDFTVLAGQEYIKGKTTDFFGSSTGQTDDRLLLIGSGPSNRNAGSSLTEYAYQSFFGRLNYGWKSKYLVDLSVRQDQSSRFGRDNRTANFWSAGILWKAKNEEFLANVGWVNDLSVRASYGTSGNSAIGNYANLATVSNGIYNGETTFGISAAGNPNLGWESQAQTSVGIEASLFKVINLKVDYYIRETSNQLFDVPFPFTSGFGSILDNVGAIKNSGVDIELSVNALTRKNGFITPWASFNYNKNEITELFQGRNYWVIPNTGVSYVIGQPVTYLYPLWAGVNTQNGLPQWYLPDPNPDNFVNPTKDQSRITNTFNSAALQQSTGIQRYAPINGGFGLDAGFKGFYMNANFAYSLGKYMINNDDYFFMNPTQFAGFNQSTAILDYWKKPGDVTRFPRYDGTTLFSQFDDRLIQNASFMRLKGLTFGYSVPKTVLQRTKFIKGADLSITGRNLWTLTKYTGPDPEVDTNVSLGANPNTKQVVVGISFKF